MDSNVCYVTNICKLHYIWYNCTSIWDERRSILYLNSMSSTWHSIPGRSEMWHSMLWFISRSFWDKRPSFLWFVLGHSEIIKMVEFLASFSEVVMLKVDCINKSLYLVSVYVALLSWWTVTLILSRLIYLNFFCSYGHWFLVYSVAYSLLWLGRS